MKRLRYLVPVLGVALAACVARGPAEPLPAHVLLDPPVDVAPVAHEDTALPSLPVETVAGLDSQERRIQLFAAQDEDLRIVLRELAHGFGLDYRIAPDVSGRVSVRLQGATLDEALRAVVLPHGYDYQVQDRVLTVGPPRLETRTFTLDYVALSRFGQSSTVLQRRVGAGVGQPGVTGAQQSALVAGGADFITTTSVADLWADIRVALEALIFDSPHTQVGQTGAVPAARPGMPGLQGRGGASATSRVDELGRRLIVNPMAGSIHVQAPPETLAEVGAYLRVFEASVQRQVLIEAKIVEVSLTRGHEFGIDWGAVRQIGNLAVRVGTQGQGQGGLQLTLEGGAGQITAVLHTLSQQGDVRVLSSPQVSALNNQRAIFNVTTDEVLFTVRRQPILGPTGGAIGFTTEIEPHQIAVGIVLDVFPQIGPDNTVSMNIRPAITSVARVETIRTTDGSEARAPVIDRREIDTFARVRPGETVVIGGLMQTRLAQDRVGVPILKDLPLLRYLFGRYTERERRAEVVIFITPTIVAGQLREEP